MKLRRSRPPRLPRGRARPAADRDHLVSAAGARTGVARSARLSFAPFGEVANKTLQVTTLSGVKIVLHIMLLYVARLILHRAPLYVGMLLYVAKTILHGTPLYVERVIHRMPLYVERVIHRKPLYVEMLLYVVKMIFHQALLYGEMLLYVVRMIFHQTLLYVVMLLYVAMTVFLSMTLARRPRRPAAALVKWRLRRDRAGRLRLRGLALRRSVGSLRSRRPAAATLRRTEVRRRASPRASAMGRSTCASFETASSTSPLASARRASFSTILWRASQNAGGAVMTWLSWIGSGCKFSSVECT